MVIINNKEFGFDQVHGSLELVIYREVTTDVLYLETDSGIVVMLNPETGKPLTYSDWKLNYKK